MASRPAISYAGVVWTDNACMPISYAQNFEDVLLARCFAGRTEGFYVDVGAAAPAAHSVSLHFYERGWRGLNVEPIPERASELRWCRPRDVVVETAVADRAGEAVLHRTAGAGGLSALSQTFLAPIAAPGIVWPIRVRVSTLSDILAAHDVGEIDFLKIDVEGAEAQVLAGLDLQRWRPVVLVIEAVTPTQPPRDNFAEWEPDLIAQGYEAVFFDGLNRYYLRAESSALAAHFRHPPCVFDGFARFEDRGDALLNRAHPDHAFALQTAKTLLRLMAGGGLDPVAAYARDIAPAALDAPATQADIRAAFNRLLARPPTPAEALPPDGLTLREALAAIIASDAFRLACARAAA